MEMSARVICFGSSGLFWSASQACIMTSSKAGSPSKTPTSSALLLPPCRRWGRDLGFLWASLALLDFLHFCFQWPIFWQEWQVESFAGSAVSLECGILCSCYMGRYVLVVSLSFSVLHLQLLLIGPLKTCCMRLRCGSAHSQHFGSSCLNLHRQEFPEQVCVTEGTDHPELDVPLLLRICGEVTSIS